MPVRGPASMSWSRANKRVLLEPIPCTEKPPGLFCSLLIQRLFTFDTAFYDADNSYTLLRKMLKMYCAIG